MGIAKVLLNSGAQLRNIGSFNPAELDPEWKDWLMRAERVFIDTFAGECPDFFWAVASKYQAAVQSGEDPSLAIQTWIMSEIEILKEKEKKH